MKQSDQVPERIALILSDDSAERQALPVALELDERLTSAGIETRLFDLTDRSYGLEGLAYFDAFIFVSGGSRPGYPPEITQVLVPYLNLWEGKHMGFVHVAKIHAMADSAERYLYQLIKHLGAIRLSRLVVLAPEVKFDKHFNLTDPGLSGQMTRFLEEFVPLNLIESKRAIHQRLIA